MGFRQVPKKRNLGAGGAISNKGASHRGLSSHGAGKDRAGKAGYLFWGAFRALPASLLKHEVRTSIPPVCGLGRVGFKAIRFSGGPDPGGPLRSGAEGNPRYPFPQPERRDPLRAGHGGGGRNWPISAL